MLLRYSACRSTSQRYRMNTVEHLVLIEELQKLEYQANSFGSRLEEDPPSNGRLRKRWLLIGLKRGNSKLHNSLSFGLMETIFSITDFAYCLKAG
ncbi:hypothetical protein AVEN_173761-1 [Araneus ventricosus]|uniref:Uncharacterized protein n=1 Tax=Araneus ventricosus TaxID=182803 RepID=A0A4Y2LW14_ARAVE|nr:hypothetical protein AVEN_173761-1 [Araneus ventricosus]